MWIPYCFQFFIISTGVHVFSLFIYFCHNYYKIVNNFQEFETEYDYIIVGSGTAGSLIGHRLGLETNYSFKIIEAGGQSNSLFEIPVFGTFLQRTSLDWQFETVPQEHACFAMNNKKCRLPQGKIVGGSSKLNNMIHIRGNISHYATWFHGRYDDQYIKDQFNFVEKNFLHLNNIEYQSDLAEVVIDAAAELGYKKLGLEFNSGFMNTILSQKNGKRWTIADNLDQNKHIIYNALVEKVIFDGNTAVGVEFSHSGKLHKLYGRKGVILSAGAINSPKILQLSGIGPAKLLKSLGIPILKNLPVGRNLQDHVGSGLDLVLFDKPISINPMDMINPVHIFDYFFNGKGVWTSPGCEVTGFISSKNQSEPDLQFMVLPVGISTDFGSLMKDNMNINNQIWTEYFSKLHDNYVTSFFTVILHPKSRGYVYINSTNPQDPPLIDPKYLSHPEDREVLINGLKLLKNIVSTAAIQKRGGYINHNKLPGCEGFDFFSTEYLDCYISLLTFTSYHPAGTCSMGVTESNSVVDTSFKVFGVNKLFVVDSSVLPTLPSGNINAAVAMMATVFVDTISKNIDFCLKNDYLYEIVYRVCY